MKGSKPQGPHLGSGDDGCASQGFVTIQCVVSCKTVGIASVLVLAAVNAAGTSRTNSMNR